MGLDLAALLRTTLPLDLVRLPAMDDGRYHSIWLPDHLVSFWPDALWTPEFTDLAAVSPSPHRHLDALSVAGAVASQTERAAIATSVVDTVRRHPVMLAQAAVTLSYLSAGRFILGVGSGEKENAAPYGFDFDRPVSRFEEAVQVMQLLWRADGPVDFDGWFFRLEHARLDAELFDDQPPPIWVGATGPRMLGLAGRYPDGWWPTGSDGPEEYAEKLAVIRKAAEDAGRDPSAIVPAKMVVCLCPSPTLEAAACIDPVLWTSDVPHGRCTFIEQVLRDDRCTSSLIDTNCRAAFGPTALCHHDGDAGRGVLERLDRTDERSDGNDPVDALPHEVLQGFGHRSTRQVRVLTAARNRARHEERREARIGCVGTASRQNVWCL